MGQVLREEQPLSFCAARTLRGQDNCPLAGNAPGLEIDLESVTAQEAILLESGIDRLPVTDRIAFRIQTYG